MTAMTWEELRTLSFCNSKDLPQIIKIRDGDKMIFKRWVGIGWIDTDPTDEAVEVIEK